jgi:putative heme-binding domain-containing protein
VATFCDADDSAPAKSASAQVSLDKQATPVERIKVAKDFNVELLYSVPRDEFGSWINLTTDPQGRLIVSEESGYLDRVTVPRKGEAGEVKIERIPVEIGQAQGLLCAFGDLYVVVNGKDGTYVNGLYRVRDTNDDDQFDSLELLRPLEGDRDHGPHAVLLAPDGKSLYVVCGNRTKLTEINRSRVPKVWDEDQLLPRVYGAGFMKGTPPPAGCIYKIDPDGKDWELISSGFRNQFDAAFNGDGELFTFDADMEWDINAPWYRPTRVCHVVSGADWGWRNGSAKWPEYYADTLPPVVNVGPGSPTGVMFGYGARFPARYQNALYLCDWTFGKIYAAHLTPKGATYSAELEDFITGTPLPITDAIINPHDGAMYFTTGGRGVQSGLYRVTYVGDEPTAQTQSKPQITDEQQLRRQLETLHVGQQPGALDEAWPHLSHADRFVRHAARTVLEHRPVAIWQQRALDETNPRASLAALTALARMYPRSYKPVDLDLDTPPPVFPLELKQNRLLPDVLAALDRLDVASLTKSEVLELLRAYGLALYRLGPPGERTRHALTERLQAMYPAAEREANVLLTELLCYLQAPGTAEKAVALLKAALTQEEQMDIARSLRFLRTGWTLETRRAFFEWFVLAQTYRGGENFRTFIGEMKTDALKGLSEEERQALKDVIDAPVPEDAQPRPVAARPFVKEWTKDEVETLLDRGLTNRDFDRGKQMFAAAQCYNCHRFDGEGGAVGPDLTLLSGRFVARDILESVMEPDKVISDQYAAVTVVTSDGKVVTGRIVNFSGNKISINTNMLDPTAIESVDRRTVEELETSPVSMMPSGLLNTLNESELLDLFAFLLSRGDRNIPMFRR